MKLQQLVFGGILVGAGLLLGLSIGGSEGTPRDAGAAAAGTNVGLMTVSVVEPRLESIHDELKVIGTTRGRDEVQAVAEIAGLRVERLAAEAGDYVRAGQVLATLDSRGLDIDSREHASELERTRGEYERARALVETQLVSREFFKQKQAAYDVARARYQATRLDVGRTRVTAPASGRVLRRNVEVGELTDPTVALFEIARDDTIEMVADVPESLVGRLRQGQDVLVDVVGRDTSVRGTVRLIQPTVDPGRRTVDVRIRLDADEGLPVGAFAEARIDVAQVEGWVIPDSAVQQDENGRYVWRVDDGGIVHRQAVTPKLQTADRVVVAERLDGMRIVARAGAFLREKEHVAIAGANG